MLARIRKAGRALTIATTVFVGFGLVSCASEKEHVALVDDPTGSNESSIPWNKQEKWESTGPLTGLTDRR
jgi:hypothetical protein